MLAAPRMHMPHAYPNDLIEEYKILAGALKKIRPGRPDEGVVVGNYRSVAR
jgi:hypothetical protein